MSCVSGRPAAASPGAAYVPQAAHSCAVRCTDGVAHTVTDSDANTEAVICTDTRAVAGSRAHTCPDAADSAAVAAAYATTVTARHTV